MNILNNFLYCILISCAFSYEIGKILQITDIHYDPYYKVGAPANCFHIHGFQDMGCCHKSNIAIEPKRAAQEYGDYNCDTPFKLINETFNWISKNHKDIDYIFYTGDTASHQHFSQSYYKNLDAIFEISNLFDYYFLNTPVYNILGNHDTWPIDQFPNYPYNQGWLTSILPHWNKYFTDDSNKTFSYGGYYSKLLDKNLRLIAINSLYYDSYNFLSYSNVYDYVEQLNWLEDTLEKSKINNEKVWLIGHIYPLATESKETFTINFNNLVKKYYDIILFQIWGHLHNDFFTLYSDSNKLLSNVINVGFVAPSLMPDKHDPSYRIYEFNKDTFEIINYYQYNADLELSNKINKLEYRLYYNAIEHYNLNDFSPTSWSILYYRMLNDKDLFNDYFQKYNVGKNITCNNKCQEKLLCGIRYNNIISNNNCLSNN